MIAAILKSVKAHQYNLRAAVHALRRANEEVYGDLNESTVRAWFTPGPDNTLLLTEKAKRYIEQKTSFQRPNNGNNPILAKHPEAEAEALDTITKMRAGGLAISLDVAASIVHAVVSVRCPELLAENGGPFTVSHTWVSGWRYTKLRWSNRAGTTAAQKLPDDHKDQVEDMCKRIAILVALYDVPRELFYAMDETFFFVPMGGAHTFDEEGKKGVAITGADDKRGGTVSLGCKADGSMLPFAAIYGGKTKQSEPGGRVGQRLPAREEAEKEGGELGTAMRQATVTVG